MLKLNLPDYDYSIKTIKGKLYIFDTVRKKYVKLTPEEWVRQHFINFLINNKGYQKNRIQVEGGKKYHTLLKRTDILVYSGQGVPLILVECKAPTVRFQEDILLQVSVYNSVVNAQYLSISNGLQTIVWGQTSAGNYKLIDDIPDASFNG